MRWLNPFALSGLVLLVVPVLIHLLSRRPPRTVVFPSLRFLTAAPRRPTRRAHIADWWLLLVRCAIVATSVVALAQPAPQAHSSADSGTPASHVVILDTAVTASTAESPAGTADAANLVLRRDAIELRSALAEAVAWLHTTPAPRAITVRSRFPRYALDSVDVARLPADITLTLEWKEPRALSAGGASSPVQRDTVNWVTALDSASIASVIRAVEEGGGDVVHAVHAGDAVQGASARTTVVTAGLATRNFARDVLPNATGASQAVARNAAAPSSDIAVPGAHSAWSRLQAVARNVLLAQMMGTIGGPTTDTVIGTPLHFSASGSAAISGFVRTPQAGGSAVLVSHGPEHPAMAAALLLASSGREANRRWPAASPTRASEHHDTATLRQWQRAPSGAPIGAGSVSDMHSVPTYARYVWMLVLLLCGAEHLLRSRRAKEPTSTELRA